MAGKDVMDTLATTGILRTTTDTVSGEMTAMMLMVRGCTVDLRPVAAVGIIGIIRTTQDSFKVHRVILWKA